MTWAFIVTVIIVFLAHTALVAYIMSKLDDSINLAKNLVCSALWTLYFGIIPFSILCDAINNKGLHYGEKIDEAYLLPLKSSGDDIVYVEQFCNTYHFQLSNDSSVWKNATQCNLSYLEDGGVPTYECFSMKAEPWVLWILAPDNKRLQPRCIVNIPRGCVREEQCYDPSDSWEIVPPY